jgi:dihydroneopterin aldolase
MGFSDAIAHRMALIAMGQFGIALASHSDAFTLAVCLREIDSALSAGRIPVWMPERMVLDTPDVPASWDLTSDSLAAWLTGIYGARRLLLIKSQDLAAPASVFDLVANKIIDPVFPHFAAQSRAEIWLAGPASLAGAVAILKRGGMPGSKVKVARAGSASKQV